MIGDVFGVNYVSGGDLYSPRRCDLRGLPAWSVAASVTLAGANRGIEDASLRGFRLYVGSNGDEPDFTAPPIEESATLPITVALADGTYRFTLRARNGYGVETQNVLSTLIRIDDGETATLPPGPIYSLTAVASGYNIRVTVTYLDDPARVAPTRFRITKVPSPPGSPTVLTPAIVTVPVEGVQRLPDGRATAVVDFVATSPPGIVVIQARAETATQNGPQSSINLSVPGATIASVRGNLSDQSAAWESEP
jgi:hypothetical protein